ncbi:exodeoxyribonuclease VII large subunit [Pseudoalteromonas denitrificans]|uniref:Exodeoxyribonuclease 7 large subunit n=1 Tax=Pseudoalteromonas denitrificans DSM 6059 TaxID=1123010 RepID=A0A1I1LYQ6_9GAMM|nr:exodeoxyribonuclease VII large subunit [Pseudoalteromonas denitrificans]SFC76068.1 Exodeoxyribonuclease VII large subunit [Pseudoalteromonas denitrificans DSM 6059]
MFEQAKKQQVYTVSKLNKDIRFLLERNFATLTLNGEISNFVAPASGHWYFTLKDDNAQIRAAMWRGNNRSSNFKPKNGDQVLVRARISLYEPRGDYQLIIEKIDPAGQGLLKQEFEALQQKLAAQGLFSAIDKQTLPAAINKVGVITSATGAAFRDILTVLKRRAPQLEVILYPAQVQGALAHQQLIDKISIANQRDEVDVIILGRGGGSLEDLWCFNNEQLAHAIFDSDIPIVSAVGHEIDTTISDFVADVRAATPSAAAELISPDSSHINSQINELKNRLNRAFILYLTKQKHYQNDLSQTLKQHHPEHKLHQQIQKLDELSMRLNHALHSQLIQSRQKLNYLTPKLQQYSPENKMNQMSMHLTQLKARLNNLMSKQLEDNKNQLAIQAAKLNSISPLTVLARGYSISNSKNGIVTSRNQIKIGEELVTQLADGKIISEVTDVLQK